MDKVAFITDSGYVYWHSIFIVLAIAAALAAMSLVLAKDQSVLALLAALPLSFAASLYIGRFVHWYCRFEGYDGLAAAMSDLGSGGFSLVGVFPGVFLVCLLLRAVRLTRDLPGLLDAIAPAGALGIALGRLRGQRRRGDAVARGHLLLSEYFCRRAVPCAAARPLHAAEARAPAQALGPRQRRGHVPAAVLRGADRVRQHPL